MPTKLTHGLGLLAAATLIACGGGGGDDPPAPSGPITEGIYSGAISGSSYSAFRLLMLEGGEYWALYGNQSGAQFLIGGFVQGTGSSANGSFASTNGRDFGFSPATPVFVTATYTATPTINGTLQSGTQGATFSGGAWVSGYNYNTPASLSALAGSWTLQTLGGSAMPITINGSTGAISTSVIGCTFTGTVAPRASGRNVFNVTLTWGGVPCTRPGAVDSGIAITYPLAGGGTQLLVALRDSARNYGSLAFGVR